MLRAMRVRVRTSKLVKGRLRFIDWVIEVDTVRGRCCRTFETSTGAGPISSPCPLGIRSSLSSPDAELVYR